MTVTIGNCVIYLLKQYAHVPKYLHIANTMLVFLRNKRTANVSLSAPSLSYLPVD